jgi:glutaredoxin
VVCDYCTKPDVAKITVHNHYWHLCLDHLKENKERLDVPQHFIDHIERESKGGNER